MKRPVIIKTGEIISVIDISDITPQSAHLEADVWGDKLTYVTRGKGFYGIKTVDLKGNETSSFTVSAGKGPGEFLHPSGITVEDERIYVSDLFLRRIVVFGKEGELIDSYVYSEETGEIRSSDVHENKLFFNSAFKSLLGSYSFETGSIKTIPYEDPEIPSPGRNVNVSAVAVDKETGDIFTAGYSVPWEIKRYDSELNLLDRYSIKTPSSYDKCRYIERLNMAGDVAVTTMAIDGERIYAPYMSASLEVKEGKFVFNPFDIEILSLDKKGASDTVKYVVPRLSRHKGLVSVIGVTDDYLILMVRGYGKVMGELLGIDEQRWATAAVLIKK